MQQPDADQLILDAIRDAPAEEAQGSAAEATSHELLGRSRCLRAARGMPGNLRAEARDETLDGHHILDAGQFFSASY